MTERDTWVELRVHGVSGTPPESLLAHPHVAQIAGDADSRFFRPVDAAGHDVRADDGHLLEAYHWGQFTSGSWIQGLWLTLIPFGMINAAQFMLPRPDSWVADVAHTVCGALLRILSLLLTCLLTFAAALVLLDLVGWRWAARTRALSGYPPEYVLAVATVASALVVVVLYFLGRGFGNVQPGEEAAAPPGPATPLADVDFYAGDADATTLRRLHLSAGLSLVALMGVWSVVPDALSAADPLAVVAALLLAASVLVTLFLGDPEGSASIAMASRLREVRRRWHRFARLASIVLACGTGLLVAAVAVAVASSSAARPDGDVGRIDVYDLVANAELWIGLGAIGLLLVANVVLVAATGGGADPVADRYFAPYARGMTTSLVGTVSAFVGVGLSAAVATGVSSALNLDVVERQGPTGETEKVRIGTTPMLDRFAYAWGLTVIFLAVLVVATLAWWLVRRVTSTDRAEAMQEAPDAATTVLPDGWTSKIAFGMWVARLKNLLPVLFWAITVFGLVLGLAIGWELMPCSGGRDRDLCRSAPPLLDWLSQPLQDGGFLTVAGAWVLLTAAGGLAWLSRRAVEGKSTRRGVNVVWDVLSFWPHATHPFVPRPYSQRTVVDLRDRIRWHLERVPEVAGERSVVVCGHSQGSLISFAAILLLNDAERGRVGFVTFGSQLRVIFARAFPAYVDLAAVRYLHGALGGAWVNLYRSTDPLAGPVLSWDHSADGPDARSQHFPEPDVGRVLDAYDVDSRRRACGDDWRLIDPTPYDEALQTGPVTALRGHSDYWLDRDWPAALTRVRLPRP